MEGVPAENKYTNKKTKGNIREWRDGRRIERKYATTEKKGNRRGWVDRRMIEGVTMENKYHQKRKRKQKTRNISKKKKI